MMKLFIISACFGIYFFWMSVLVDAYPTTANPQMEPVSTPLSLFILGSGLCALAFWGKRTKTDE